MNLSDGGPKRSRGPKVLTSRDVQRLKCVNRRCKSGDELTEAVETVCTYYNVGYNPRKQVCLKCLKKCIKHYELLEEKWLAGECIFDSHFPSYDSHYVIESDEDESEEEPQPSTSRGGLPPSDNTVAFVNSAFDLFLKNNQEMIDTQVKLCNEHLDKTLADCLTEADEIDKLTDELNKDIMEIRNNLYEPYKPKIKMLEPLHIDDDDDELLEKILNEDKKLNKNKKNDEFKANKKFKSDKEDVITVNKTICAVPADLPREGIVEYPPLRTKQVVYAMKFTVTQPWYECQIKSSVNEDNVHIKFDDDEKKLTTKEIAFFEQNPVQFPVGSRVIAKFTDDDSEIIDLFYAGVIAEPPKILNQFRYLIFYDNGVVQYRHHKDIRLIVHKSNQVWNFVQPDSKEFIKSYLEKYPERQMVRLKKKHLVRAEYKNQWQLAKVLEVDASLVKLCFMDLKKCEWLYRGSLRLWNIFEKQSKSERGIRLRQSGLAYLEKPFVEYSKIGEEHPPTPVKTVVRCVARKSTSKSSTTVHKEETPKTYTNDKPKLISLLLPNNIHRPREYKVHTCNPSCVEWTQYIYAEAKHINMLAIPLHYGFRRYKTYFTNKMVKNFKLDKCAKCVMYKTPCGVTIRNIKEMLGYLMATKSKMTIDQFDFASWVNPLQEFKPSTSTIKFKDISNGKEFLPISCVNNINDKSPPVMEYLTSRQARPGVNINVDENFLCGCDCTDNCQDKSKCACWQMTIEGQKILPNIYKDPNIGYNFRRLPERVLTGIYECNKTCKCNNTCLNRVVQHPLTQKLQLFLTEKKGWGVRCLNDIPQGSFICIYVGYLLTESDANEGGKNYGDEYLAELDYIEVVEKIKEDYESDVPLSDQEESDISNIDDHSMNSETSDEDFQSTSKSKNSVSSDIALRLRKNKKPKNETKTKIDRRHERIPSKLNARVIKNKPEPAKSMREYFGNNESVYIMDAKTSGNIGRYLNHSCSPNTFVQNVFVDTQDQRFPWISFFALHYIKAGTELTWDYSYDIGSVPGKVMKCHCDSVYCRGRLL